uniref:Putative reverse transcriptase domain-containing protein n=1 Tax=Tanacetum cinerariifolium TaxID=118510 RepID=A0A6L2JMT2_TANCI|nr:putative reverse transcriptase domain-containing protein [Tanacetum cinerariifolium]
MADFVPGRTVIDVAQRKRDKYMDKCAAIGYEFLLFSFSSLGELEADAVSLLKQIRKFSMTHDIGARTVIHIFNMISFAIAKGIITKQSLTTSLVVFEAAKVTFKRMGLWLCGVCFKTRTLRSKCRHGEGSDFVSPPDYGDGEVRFVLYDITKPQVPSFSVLHDHVDELVLDEHVGLILPILDRLLSKGLCMVKSIPPKCHLRFSRVLKGALDKVICTPDDISFRVLSSSGVAPYNDATLKDLKTKHPFKPAPSLPHKPINYHQLTSSPVVVLDMIKSFSCGTSCRWDGLRAQHLMDCLSGVVVAISDELVFSITQVVNLFLDGKCIKTLGEYISSALLTSLVKPGGGILPIVVGTIWRRYVSKVSAIMIGHSLDGYLNDM